MCLKSDHKNPNWFVLNYIGSSFRDRPEKVIDRFNSSHETALELFAPTYVVREETNGDVKFRTVSLTFHYVFVKGSFEGVKQLCGETNGFSFLIDRSALERYAVIDDRQMMYFQNIARAYRNCLPYFRLDDIDLEDGDLVEVVKGDFPGLIGRYMPNAKSKTGNVVLSIFNNVGTVAFNVNANEVRVLEFAKNSTRANDQIDAFIPHLMKALRSFADNEPLAPGLAAKLSVFCGRMAVVKLNNRKLDGRLQIMRYAANHIIGNSHEAAEALERFYRVKDAVTNEWTIAMNELIMSVLANDMERLSTEFDRIKTLDASSKIRKMILEEYNHYLS